MAPWVIRQRCHPRGATAGLWAASFVAGGWFLGAAFEEGYAAAVLGAVALAIIAFVIYRGTRARRAVTVAAKD